MSLSYLEFSFLDVFHQICGDFGHFFFMYFYVPFIFLRLPLCICCTFDDVLQVSEALFIFIHSFFFLFPRLDDLDWPIFMFADSFFSLLTSALEPLWRIFNLSYCTFQLQNFNLVLFYNFCLFIDILYLVRYHSQTSVL